ncbi:response regulator transcription factor [Culicoidibacter larvae]|uniref:Response regulator transcription factor n=1 Tax=Culicoidibacter larvae TaxID=2579976 RepID=A0A5R8QHK6_9FIRM|nr:response regulator transcription factor [Culicoidibacter larvae]TLG76747.1 response regulator transcription factor [Culicoidibacter larvae]
MYKILFVDDDIKFQSVIAEVLRLEGYEVDLASNVADGLSLFKDKRYDLVLSDIMMDMIDGLQFLAILQKLDSRVKVILLTGSDEEDDEVRGLELRASDFIKKPVSIRVLLTRINRALHKGAFTEEVEYLESRSQKLKVNFSERKVFKSEQEIQLTRLEFDVLIIFLLNKNTVLPREEIISKIWKGNEFSVDPRNVDQVIKQLRRKLELFSIYSVRGIGYEWSE